MDCHFDGTVSIYLAISWKITDSDQIKSPPAAIQLLGFIASYPDRS
jgi:hypothetical protein